MKRLIFLLIAASSLQVFSQVINPYNGIDGIPNMPPMNQMNGSPAVVDLGTDQLCPFNPPPAADISSMITNIKTQLEKFKKECPQLASIADAASNSTSYSSSPASLRVIMSGRDSTTGQVVTYSTNQAPAVSINGLQMDCNNFTALLEIEMQNALNNPNSAQRYTECNTNSTSMYSMPGMPAPQDPNPQSCVVRIYSRDKAAMKLTCQSTGQIRLQADFLKNLQATSQAVSDAIANSSICNNGVAVVAKDAMYRTGSSLLGSISSVGIAFGLPGLALSVGANIAEGMLRNSAVDGTADDYLHKLSEEKEFPVMACLWLKIQDNILKCESTPQKSINLNGYKPPLCEAYLIDLPGQLVDHSSISQLLNYFTEKKNENDYSGNKRQISMYNSGNAAASTTNSKADDFEDELITSFNENINKLIAHPTRGAGDPIKVRDHLDQIMKTLGSEKNDQLLKSKVSAFRELLKINDEILNTDNDDKSRVLKKAFREKLSSLDLGKVIDAYWKKQNLGVIEGIKSDVEAELSVSEILGIMDHLSPPLKDKNQSHGISLITPANASITIFKNKFENRLERAAKRYSNAIKDIKGDSTSGTNIPKVSLDEMKIAAEELTQICSLLGGMYNSPASLSNESNPLTKVSGKNNLIYRNSCKHVECLQTTSEPKQSIVLPEKLNENLNNPEAYRQYQCSNKLDHRLIIKELNKKLNEISKSKPEICGPGEKKGFSFFN